MENQFIDVGAIRTRYLEAGSGGVPVVFVHGGTIGDANSASSADDFLPLIQACSATRRAISVDRLGHGYTDNPPEDDLEGWTMDGSVKHFIRFLEVMNAGQRARKIRLHHPPAGCRYRHRLHRRKR
ncbi:hypothetical protein [Pseudotabrizicola sp. 4114]|uniref:alpha/beta fold hydrolase n=1 Tax=Pseudotabrizicola sp. 4114 TaxID=2817731 RepID=UPI00285FAD6C|nr:pimeloyl-ACP methyl ester carboxylesterase [Pseudorhodobacter sp. 4114]